MMLTWLTWLYVFSAGSLVMFLVPPVCCLALALLQFA
jgi:hypothetical protein